MKPNKIYILHDIGKTELTPEEAKEHLSDTELPPNMKKIIEGVGKMSKLDEIKGRLNKWMVSNTFSADGVFDEILSNATVDIEYLLSKLEIAEKALEWYAKIPHYDRRLSGGTSAVEADAGGRSREALQQIRE